ncbi:phosphatidylserine decarboxylase family protein [Rhodopirellula bahusiensis]|uniref:Phosphatidylserine decarboxylase family protein n=2 Tax=Rhodopirellula bahusiensis TaxID=2014065 RepID=A0A2G1W4V5_9BACT|nr:phosphatidylserine decarboxylase family protein [Rhodopirellula bahusiensis]PHQ34063.1 phosphatidylserine decarboxylase family protein [Rhodopirellula bahusiensis]
MASFLSSNASVPLDDPSPPFTDASTMEVPAMDPALKSIQPGGGVVMSIELAWGKLRRAWLNSVRPKYVSKMRDRRQGHRGDLPFEPVDSRDMKYYRNQDSYWWADADDPFLWRESLPFVRVGLAELIVMCTASVLLALIAGWFWWPLALPFVLIAGLVAWFFRNPRRQVPGSVGTVVAPADGKLVEIVEFDDPVIGSAIRFGIFLSIFNVHANRIAMPGRVVRVRYRPGKFMNALRSESSKENENMDVELECPEIGGRIVRIRQITGQFARRIVCWARVGDVLQRGEMFGMIKLGSRTELVIPHDEALEIVAQVGEKVCAGSTVFARYQQG